MKNLLYKIGKISFRDCFLFAEACCYLIIASFAKEYLPFHWYVFLLGKQEGYNSDKESVEIINKSIKDCQIALFRARRYLPLEGKCLVRTIVGTLMLRRQGIPSRAFFGVDKEGDKLLKAHAWLKVGEHFFTGKKEERFYKVITTFSR